MKNNKSMANLTPSNLAHSLTFKALNSPASRKVQGFDKTILTQNFSSKVDKLRTKPKTEALQDQYIKGLQDEIKYLQMELKLLQEKDMEKHGQIDQLQKFFGDGIPINENILAIKNGFNNYKQNNQKKIKQLAGERQERVTLIDGLAEKVQKLLKQVNQNEKNNRGSLRNCQEQLFKLIGSEAALKRNLDKQEDELKLLKQQNRKVFQNIEKISRNKIIENITIIKQENNKMNKLNSLKEQSSEKNSELLELQKQYAALQKDQNQKLYIIRIEEDNLAQRKKIITMERQYDNIKNKIKEKQMDLQQKLKERLSEIAANRDIQNKVEALKEQIKKQNSITIQYVTQIARTQEIDNLKKIVDSNRVIARYTDHYSNILSNIENSIQALAQRKPEAKSEIQTYSEELKRLRVKMLSQQQREISIHAELIQLQEQFNEIKSKISPLQQKSRKNNDQTQAYLQERSRITQEIKIKQKQLELIFILKGLNFQETQISKTSNRNIQEELVNFLKNWEKIQRTF